MAGLKIKMSMKQFLRYQVRLGKEFKPAIEKGLLSGAQRCLPILVKSTDEAPPASPHGQKGANNTGAYRRAWDAERIQDGARVWNKMKYSSVIEKGRKPGKRPPPSKTIQHWLMRRKGMDETEAKHVAYAVARAIGKRGLKGRRVMGRVREEMAKVVLEETVHELEGALRGRGR